MKTDAIKWTDDGKVSLLDQTLLPREARYIEIDSVTGMIEAIRSLRVRGAPLIGIAAAMGLVAHADTQIASGNVPDDADGAIKWLESAGEELANARPTAVNLAWAVKRMIEAVRTSLHSEDSTSNAFANVLRHEADLIWEEDAEMCRAIGDAGADLLEAGGSILTHCNTGMLATGGIGTAFGVIRTLHDRGKLEMAYACEARPLKQGARLTAWELTRIDAPGTVLVDSAAGALMQKGAVDAVIVGADRIAANGDVANKIGTLNLAVLAKRFGIPFYVAAPSSTVDYNTPTGDDIEIEMRSRNEIETVDGVEVFNPAFDVTSEHFVTGIITERGVIKSPYIENLANAFSDGEE